MTPRAVGLPLLTMPIRSVACLFDPPTFGLERCRSLDLMQCMEPISYHLATYSRKDTEQLCCQWECMHKTSTSYFPEALLL